VALGSKESLIPRFIKSLEKEISSNIKSNNKLVFFISEGKFIGKESKNFMYKFALDNVIHPVDGIIIELIVEDNKFKGRITQCFEHEINISLESNIGKYVKNAQIEIKLTSLLEILKNKIKEIYDNKKYMEFHLANHFFEGYGDSSSFSSIMPGFDNLLKEYNEKKNEHNTDPAGIVFPESILMLAHIIGAFMKTDVKVLLVSNKKTFINKATVCIAESLKEDNLYKFGKIVNQVAQESNDIFKGHELIIPKRIIKRLKGLSDQEKKDLMQKIKDIDNTLVELARGLELIQKRDNDFKKVKQLSDEIEILGQKIKDIEKNLSKQKKRMEFLSKKLKNKNKSGFISIFLTKLGFNPEQKKLSALERDLANKNQELFNVQSRNEQLEKQRKNIADIMQNIHNELFAFLGKFNLTENKLHDEYNSLISQRETIKTKITDIDTQLKLITNHVLSNAKMIGTTLNMTFLSNEFEDLHFDILVVDESSLSSEPQLYWALCKCKMAAIIVGDYLKFVVPSNSL